MNNWDSNISRFCYKIQSYRRTFGKLLEGFLNKRYVAESENGAVTIEANSKLKIESVKVSPAAIKDKKTLEDSTRHCIEKIFDEYVEYLKDVKSEFNVMRSQLKKECDPQILTPSKRILEK